MQSKNQNVQLENLLNMNMEQEGWRGDIQWSFRFELTPCMSWLCDITRKEEQAKTSSMIINEQSNHNVMHIISILYHQERRARREIGPRMITNQMSPSSGLIWNKQQQISFRMTKDQQWNCSAYFILGICKQYEQDTFHHEKNSKQANKFETHNLWVQ